MFLFCSSSLQPSTSKLSMREEDLRMIRTKKTKKLKKNQKEDNKDSSPPSSLSPIDNLPNHILSEIFLRLPFKCLQRSKCVSKSWLSLINSSSFTTLHRRHSLASPNQHSPYRLLIFTTNHADEVLTVVKSYRRRSSLYYIDLDDSLECSAKKIVLPPSIERFPIKHVVGSCNGLLLFVAVSFVDTYYHHFELAQDIGALVLLNPSTGAYREIPLYRKHFPFKNFALAYDSSMDDYKVVAIRREGAWVYSFKVGFCRFVSGLRIMNHSLTLPINDNNVVIDNHLMHWLFVNRRTRIYNNDDVIDVTSHIVCFDVCNEQWSEVPMPDKFRCLMGYNHYQGVPLSVLDGCLCFLACVSYCQFYEVMVMKEYGIKESWVKLFDISDPFHVRFQLKFCPIAYSRSKNEILLWIDSGSKIFWYNLSDKTRKTTKIQGLELEPQDTPATMKSCVGTPLYTQIRTCIQSLAPFPVQAAISSKNSSPCDI